MPIDSLLIGPETRAHAHAHATLRAGRGPTTQERRLMKNLLAGLDTTEIGCCGITDSVCFLLGTDGCLRLSAERSLGCNSCYSEPGIRSFAADSNTWRCHLRRPCFHPVCTHASYCCIHRDLGSLLGPCRSPSGCFGISESIELTFYITKKQNC